MRKGGTYAPLALMEHTCYILSTFRRDDLVMHFVTGEIILCSLVGAVDIPDT
jgi:hypothetical protein